jgi:hypothetical protein
LRDLANGSARLCPMMLELGGRGIALRNPLDALPVAK